MDTIQSTKLDLNPDRSFAHWYPTTTTIETRTGYRFAQTWVSNGQGTPHLSLPFVFMTET
ncbi:hypothetical protein Hanom_Chr15g01398191 [Helianthus anomalus]